MEIREGVKVIEDRAFEECYSLAKISIPGSMESIDDDAFSFQNGLLRNIVIHPETTLDFANETGCTIHQLKNRFVDLPLLRLCFEQSKYS